MRASATFPADRATQLGAGTVLTPYAPGAGLPLFIQPTDAALARDGAAFTAWLTANGEAIEALIGEAGAIVLRGFPIADTEAFGAIVEHFGVANLAYTGGASPRRQLGAKVFEATHSPPETVIGLHQEMTYLPHYPARLAFFCRMPSITGGETIIADMRRYTAMLPSGFRQRLEERGVLYTRNFRAPDRTTGDAVLDTMHKSWTTAFSTDDPEAALAGARAMGLGAEWLADGSLSVTHRAPGFVRHPATGETLSFNQIPSQTLGPGHRLRHADGRPLPYETSYGDGSPIDWADVVALRALLDDLVVSFPWSGGDVMVLDNFLTAHGRNAFSGVRDVQVALLR